MIELAGPMAIVALALAVSGAFKLSDPAPTAGMLASLGLVGSGTSRGRLAARGIGIIEVTVGVAAVLVGGAASYVVAGLYAVFALVMARLVSMGPAASSCGCFGALSTRPMPLHVAADIAAAGVALAAALVAAPGLIGAWEELGAVAGLVLASLVVLGAWAFVAVMTVLPDALDAAGRTGSAPSTTFRLIEVRSSRGAGRRRPGPDGRA